MGIGTKKPSYITAVCYISRDPVAGDGLSIAIPRRWGDRPFGTGFAN